MATAIIRDAPPWSHPLLKAALWVLFPSAQQAARAVIWAILSPDLADRSGVYLHLGQEKEPSPSVRDSVFGDALWDQAHALVRQHTGQGPDGLG
jgi:hypothetical protein